MAKEDSAVRTFDAGDEARAVEPMAPPRVPGVFFLPYLLRVMFGLCGCVLFSDQPGRVRPLLAGECSSLRLASPPEAMHHCRSPRDCLSVAQEVARGFVCA